MSLALTTTRFPNIIEPSKGEIGFNVVWWTVEELEGQFALVDNCIKAASREWEEEDENERFPDKFDAIKAALEGNHDIQIKPTGKAGADQLQLDVTAKTYRYLDEAELQAADAERRKNDPRRRPAGGK